MKTSEPRFVFSSAGFWSGLVLSVLGASGALIGLHELMVDNVPWLYPVIVILLLLCLAVLWAAFDAKRATVRSHGEALKERDRELAVVRSELDDVNRTLTPTDLRLVDEICAFVESARLESRLSTLFHRSVPRTLLSDVQELLDKISAAALSSRELRRQLDAVEESIVEWRNLFYVRCGTDDSGETYTVYHPGWVEKVGYAEFNAYVDQLEDLAETAAVAINSFRVCRASYRS